MNLMYIWDLTDDLASGATDNIADYLQLKYEIEELLEKWGIPAHGEPES